MYSEIYAELSCMYLGQVLAGLGQVPQAEGVLEITQSRTASAPRFPRLLRSYVALAGSPDRLQIRTLKIRLACQGNVLCPPCTPKTRLPI